MQSKKNVLLNSEKNWLKTLRVNNVKRSDTTDFNDLTIAEDISADHFKKSFQLILPKLSFSKFFYSSFVLVLGWTKVVHSMLLL